MTKTSSEVYERWIELLGISGVLPFPVAFTRWLINLFDLPVDFFSVRLASAFWGALTVAFAFGMGRALNGNRLGFITALLLALHPVHIQLSREAYFYPPVIAGAFLSFWAAIWLVRYLQHERRITPWFYAVAGGGFFLTVHIMPTTWLFSFLIAGFIGMAVALRALRGTEKPRHPFLLLLLYVLLMAPVMVSHWGLPQLLQYTKIRGMGATEWPFWPVARQFLLSYGWGSSPWRILWAVCVLLGLVALLWRSDRNRRVLVGAVAALMATGAGFVLVSCMAAGQPLAARYMMHLFPGYLLLMALGLLGLADTLARGGRNSQRAVLFSTGCVMLVSVLAYARPAYLSTRLRGTPTPYRDIIAWTDSHLARGTPILVDRWLEAWNELPIHGSTNVYFTFTVPNDSVQAYKDCRWRETAVRFFFRNPDAAYLEISKLHWNVPEIGPWEWPRSYFARQVEFTDETFHRLEETGLCFRGATPGTPTVDSSGRHVVELLYNLPEDSLRMASAMGGRCALLFGEGWGYRKLNLRATHDFRDWRMLYERATLALHNMTDEPIRVRIQIEGTASRGSRKIHCYPNGGSTTFQPDRTTMWETDPLELQPGETIITLSNPAYSLHFEPLLVSSIRLAEGS